MTREGRVGRIERTTKETSVLVEIDLDGTGRTDIATGVGFYDHMLDQLGRHGLFDLTVKTDGDLHIDSHHTIEDTALALGAAFKQALGDKVGIYRFGNCTVPLDESLAEVTVDLSGRPYLVHTEPENMAPMIGEYDTTMTRHILESFVAQAQIALHVHVPYGRNAHHIVECQFKALARALRYASERDPARPASSPPRRARCKAMNGLSTVLIVVGLFLVGGIISFAKQQMPRSLIVLLSISAGLCLVAGVLRLEVWN
ncbi:Imidazoleglycerol-phosphate dehydratase [Streptomyces sp. MBT84]|nr:Imidazoleglycerol-phosphate dehydratase [Streptomyces sp. MBT84]